MKFYNRINAEATVKIYRQDDDIQLAARASYSIPPNGEQVSKPGDNRKWKAWVKLQGNEHWANNLVDGGQWIKIEPDGSSDFKLVTGRD